MGGGGFLQFFGGGVFLQFFGGSSNFFGGGSAVQVPPGTADSGIRSTIGRYASYWNAFLSINKISPVLLLALVDKYGVWISHSHLACLCQALLEVSMNKIAL